MEANVHEYKQTFFRRIVQKKKAWLFLASSWQIAVCCLHDPAFKKRWGTFLLTKYDQHFKWSISFRSLRCVADPENTERIYDTARQELKRLHCRLYKKNTIEINAPNCRRIYQHRNFKTTLSSTFKPNGELYECLLENYVQQYACLGRTRKGSLLKIESERVSKGKIPAFVSSHQLSGSPITQAQLHLTLGEVRNPFRVFGIKLDYKTF